MFPIQQVKSPILAFILAVGLGLPISSPAKEKEPETERPTLPELTSTVAQMKKLKSRAARGELLVGFAESIRKKTKALSADGIDENDIPKTELLFELDLFLSGLSADALTKKNCPRTLLTIEGLADPNGDGIDVNPSGAAVRGLIQDACRD